MKLRHGAGDRTRGGGEEEHGDDHPGRVLQDADGSSLAARRVSAEPIPVRCRAQPAQPFRRVDGAGASAFHERGERSR